MLARKWMLAIVIIKLSLFTHVCFSEDDLKAISIEQLPKNDFNTVTESPTGDSAALFVGVNEFTKDNGLASLNFAVNDAIAQAHLFVRELKLIPAKNCILALSGQSISPVHQAQLALLKKDGVEIRPATKSDILSSLTIVSRLPVSGKDIIIVSFSSHGFEDGQGIYIMPADGLRSYLPDTAIRSKILSDGIASSKAGKKLVFMDACRERVDKNKSSGSGHAMSDAFKKAFAASTGQATLMSCDIGQYSYEDPQAGQGVFTQFLLEALRGKANPDENGFVTIGSVSGYVTENVRRWIIRNKPEVEQEKIPMPWLGAPESARKIPLAIGAEFPDSKVTKLRDDYRQNTIKDTPAGTTSQPKADISILTHEKTLTNSIGMKLVYIPAGSFQMGSNKYSGEQPVRTVTLTKGFWIGQYEVTQAEYEKAMGSNPSKFQGNRNPVEMVTWHDAVKFCEKLSQMDGRTYTLPTEAQWEYACRAGTTTEYCYGDSDSELGGYAWYDSNSGGKTHPVGTKNPNDFKLYDMHGNVWEWCLDWYEEGFYSRQMSTDPLNEGYGDKEYRVLRGGSWNCSPYFCRAAFRNWVAPVFRNSDVGFRVVCLDF